MQLQSYKSLKEGYTLVELLIGITIISIVFTIGYAGFRDFCLFGLGAFGVIAGLVGFRYVQRKLSAK